MDFQDAYQTMREGGRVSLPGQSSFWQWSNQRESIHIVHDNVPMDFRQVKNTDELITWLGRDDWELIDPVEDEVSPNNWWANLDFRPDEPHILKRGDRDAEDDPDGKVATLQAELNRYGARLKVDGIFGGNLQRAVKNVQIAHGLIQDGIFGDKTAAALQGQPIPQAATQAKMDEVAQRIGCDVEAIMAVSMVESRGRGFWSNGFPVILFERLWMYRLLKQAGRGDLKRLTRQQPNIVMTRGGGYKGGIAEYGRLHKAIAIDNDAAKSSASWGAYQVLGLHWEALGYPSVDAYVRLMETHEDHHLEAFARFILNDQRLVDALCQATPDFHRFALIYNGPNAVEQNNYPAKMHNHFDSLVLARQGK